MAKPRVLVVEDKENMRKLLEKILEESYDVQTAADGARGIDLVRHDPSFDLVLTDIRMPGADGFEVLKAVKDHSPATEVILITAHASVPKAVDVAPARRVDLAIRYICTGSLEQSHKSKKPIEECLADEVIMASNNDMNSFSVSKKEEIERVASSAR